MHEKIDIYEDGVYSCSTNQSRTLQEAINSYIEKFNDDEGVEITADYPLRNNQ